MRPLTPHITPSYTHNMANVAQILCDVISPEADARSTHVHLFATLKHSTDRRTDGPPDRYTEIPLHTLCEQYQ